MHTIKLTSDLEQRLTSMANERHTTADHLIRRAVCEYIEDWEDLKAARSALSDPKARYYTNAEIAVDLGL